MANKLWLLGPQSKWDESEDRSNPWYFIYDCAYGFVVCAETSDAARSFAADQAGDEGRAAWLNEAFSFCDELTPDEPGVVLRDFHAG